MMYTETKATVTITGALMPLLSALTAQFECTFGHKAAGILMGPMEYLRFWAEMEQFCLAGQQEKSLGKELRKRKPTKYLGYKIFVKTSPGIELAVPPEMAPRLAHHQLEELNKEPTCPADAKSTPASSCSA